MALLRDAVSVNNANAQISSVAVTPDGAYAAAGASSKQVKNRYMYHLNVPLALYVQPLVIARQLGASVRL